MTEAWLMPETFTEIRDENRRSPNVPVTLEELSDLGVTIFRYDPKTMLEPQGDDNLSPIDALAKRMKFIGKDEVKCSPQHLPDYEKKLAMFCTEHIHEDDEIRLIVDGSGFFDVRNHQDKYIRIFAKAGDLIIVPCGIYHRFTMDSNNYIHAIRYFSDSTQWSSVNRPCDQNDCRIRYLAKYGHPSGPIRETPFGAPDNENNFYIQHPEKFDETVKPLMQKISETNGKDLLVIYFTGEDLPCGINESWCPDCVVAKPILKREVDRVRAKFEQEGNNRKLIFVTAGVNRASYMGNPDYLYRKHPFCRVTGGVPTVLVLAGQDNGEGFEKQRLDGEVPENWILKED